MAGNKSKKKTAKKKDKKPSKLGFFADDFDEEIDTEEAMEYLQDNLDEDIPDDPDEVVEPVNNAPLGDNRLDYDNDGFDDAVMAHDSFKPKTLNLFEEEEKKEDAPLVEANNEEPLVEVEEKPTIKRVAKVEVPSFFAMEDDEEEELPKVEKKKPVANTASRLFDEGRNAKNELKAIFGEEIAEAEDDFELEEDDLLKTLADRKKRDEEARAEKQEDGVEVNLLGVNVNLKDVSKESLNEALGLKKEELISKDDSVFDDAKYDSLEVEEQRKSDEEIEEMMEQAILDEDESKLQIKPTPSLSSFVSEKPEPEENKTRSFDELMNDLKPSVDWKSVFESKDAKKPEEKEEAKNESDPARVAVFTEKAASYGSMYKVDVNTNNFANYVIEAWKNLKEDDLAKKEQGQNIMCELFKSSLKVAFDVEKNAAYQEGRLPEYAEITKSTNELLRSAMFAFTDLYHDPKNEILFKATAFGGLNEKEIAELTKGESHWDLDQKSDKAWEIQSGAAKNIANEWLKEPKPYEKLIQELNTLSSTAQKNDPYDRREARLKIAAAEWLLLNNPVMMVQDPNDPLNPIPNWGNRYWKALTQTREALGIDKHTPIRTLIQEEYAEAARAAKSTTYHETQVKENVLSDDARAKLDSMEMQKIQFATQSAHVNLTEKQTEKDQNEIEVTGEKVKISIKILDQREIDRNSPKNYGDFKMEHTADVKIASNEKDDKMII